MGLRETKPINFGSQKAEGNKTNTVLRGDPRRGKDIFLVFKVEGRETHKFWESQSREKRNQYSAWVWRGMGRDILGGNIEGNSHSVGPWGGGDETHKFWQSQS